MSITNYELRITNKEKMMKAAKLFIVLIVALIFCQGQSLEAALMGTAFTYQGHLYDSNSIANGSYDLQFKLFDGPAGAPIGSAVDKPSVSVSDGLFPVKLDFGSSVFDGDARWLEIGVRDGDLEDPNTYDTLSPLQEITAVPYALHTRGIFVDDNGNVGIGTTPDPEDKLSVVTAGSDDVAVLGEATHTTGNTMGVEGVVFSPNGIAGSFVNESGAGLVLICHSGTDPYDHAFNVASNGDITAEGNVYARGTGTSMFEGSIYVSGTQHVESNLSTNGTLSVSGTADFGGNLNVGGTLYKANGAFKIDHPMDPENKYLSHSFVESPDMMNVYNGNVVLDKKGGALVKLPDYFETLNADFRYQLTCIGGFAPVYVADEISTNQFKIAGGKPGMKVSWQVTGVRQDAFANANPIVVEQAKAEVERGYYLYPEAYGLGKDKSIANLHNQLSNTANAVARKAGTR